MPQGDALQRLYPSQPQGLPRPFERSGHWVPGTSPGTTALDLARASPSGTRCVNVVGSTPRVTVKVGALAGRSPPKGPVHKWPIQSTGVEIGRASGRERVCQYV